MCNNENKPSQNLKTYFILLLLRKHEIKSKEIDNRQK